MPTDVPTTNSDELYKSLFENSHAIMLIIHPETGHIEDANPAACSYYGYPKENITNMSIQQINTLSADQVVQEMQKAKSECRNYFNFRHRLADGAITDVGVYSSPIVINNRKLLYSVIHDISERKADEKEREELISKLEHALAEINSLKEILPICASCKKVRDDDGSWSQLESYIAEHSGTEFSHGICPECTSKYFPDLDIYKNI